MSAEDFELIDIETIDNSYIKRDFARVYHQQGAQINYPDQNIDFIFGDKNIYYMIGVTYLEFDKNVPIADIVNITDANRIRLVNNAFAMFLYKQKFQLEEGLN